MEICKKNSHHTMMTAFGGEIPSPSGSSCELGDDILILSGMAEAVLGRPGPEFSTDDPDIASEKLLQQFSPNRLRLIGDTSAFRMRLRLRRTGGLALSSLSFNTEVELAQEALGNFVLITTQFSGLSVISSRTGDDNGGAGLVVVDSANGNVTKRFSADSRRLNVRIDQQALTTLCSQMLGRSLKQPLEFLPVLPSGGLAQRRWLLCLRDLLDHAVQPPPPGAAAAIHRQLEERAMLVLLANHRHTYTHLVEAPSPGIAPRHVKAAEEFIEANADEPLTLADVAGAAGVSIRTLTSGFRQFRETSPMDYLKDVRLERVRADLLGGANGASVSEIACRWGFNNLGRFAGDYSRRFGEKPSATLARRR